MTVQQLSALLNAPNQTPGADEAATVQCACTCDLLSWALGHGRPGMAWITVQTHVNVVAVAVLLHAACVILPDGLTMDPDVMEQARQEGLPVLTASISAYQICGRMYQAGIQ